MSVALITHSQTISRLLNGSYAIVKFVRLCQTAHVETRSQHATKKPPHSAEVFVLVRLMRA